jgi:hypothetical protein
VIIVGVFLWLVGWGYWLMSRDVRDPFVTAPQPSALRRATVETTALGLEDDPDLWRAGRGAWTAWDEHQLIRLLTDAAPVNRPATNAVDNAVPQLENKDTP